MTDKMPYCSTNTHFQPVDWHEIVIDWTPVFPIAFPPYCTLPWTSMFSVNKGGKAASWSFFCYNKEWVKMSNPSAPNLAFGLRVWCLYCSILLYDQKEELLWAKNGVGLLKFRNWSNSSRGTIRELMSK